MANFCTKCGSALENGICPQCAHSTSYPRSRATYAYTPQKSNSIKTSMLKRMGIYEPDVNEADLVDLYERNKNIVPDCIETSEDEIPVQQYDVAILRSRLKFMRAEGRIQVTNKRLLFRAKGRSLIGRTTLQYDFALNEIAGVEVRRDYRFGVADIILGLIISSIISFIFSRMSGSAYMNDSAAGNIVAVFFGIGGVLPFFLVKKRFFLKLLCCSVASGSLSGVALSSIFSNMLSSMLFGGGRSQGNTFMIILFLITAVIEIIALLLFAFIPNLVFIIKTKGATGAIEIKRKTKKDEYTGYSDVMPVPETDKAIREISTMISDINAKGDYALTKWAKKQPDEGA